MGINASLEQVHLVGIRRFQGGICTPSPAQAWYKRHLRYSQ